MKIKIMNTKPFWQSKLLWLGLIEIAIGVLTYLSGEINNGGAITFNGVMIVVLRLITSQKVSLR